MTICKKKEFYYCSYLHENHFSDSIVINQRKMVVNSPVEHLSVWLLSMLGAQPQNSDQLENISIPGLFLKLNILFKVH